MKRILNFKKTRSKTILILAILFYILVRTDALQMGYGEGQNLTHLKEISMGKEEKVIETEINIATDGNISTIAWISDTQYYSSKYPYIFNEITSFLQENKKDKNISYIVMTGDIVDNAADIGQWEIARKAMDRIEDIPYGVLAGNKDQNDFIGYDNYEKYFGYDRFEKAPYYTGYSQSNKNHYDLIDIGSDAYVFVYLSYQPEQKDMDWASKAFKKHSDRIGVLCVHDYFKKDSSLSKKGKALQNKVVEKNDNVYMVLSGHKTHEDIVVNIYTNSDGKSRTTYECIANYQGLDMGGSGYIRFLELDDLEGTIGFYTYSPYLSKINILSDESLEIDEMLLPMPWR